VDAKQAEEYLEGFNRGTIISTAYMKCIRPLHQFVWSARAPSKVRKLLGARPAEGWAHYNEQMSSMKATGTAT